MQLKEYFEKQLTSALASLDPRVYVFISTLTVFTFVALSWLVVWYFILGKIPFVREVLGIGNKKKKRN